MNPQIIKDVVDDIIKVKAEGLITQGIILATYEELSKRLMMCGYTEAEIKAAIVELVQAKQLKTGKHYHGKDEYGEPIYKGWLRKFYKHLDQ